MYLIAIYLITSAHIFLIKAVFLQPACKLVESLAIGSCEPDLRLLQSPAGWDSSSHFSATTVCPQTLATLLSKSLLVVSVPSHQTEDTPIAPKKWGTAQTLEAGHWEASCKECAFVLHHCSDTINLTCSW